jgi:hypothetical protein
MVQLRTKLHVFLKNNTKEDVCDYRVEANFSTSSCVVYAGQSSSQVAKVCRTFSLSFFFFFFFFFKKKKLLTRVDSVAVGCLCGMYSYSFETNNPLVFVD